MRERVRRECVGRVVQPRERQFGHRHQGVRATREHFGAARGSDTPFRLGAGLTGAESEMGAAAPRHAHGPAVIAVHDLYAAAREHAGFRGCVIGHAVIAVEMIFGEIEHRGRGGLEAIRAESWRLRTKIRRGQKRLDCAECISTGGVLPATTVSRRARQFRGHRDTICLCVGATASTFGGMGASRGRKRPRSCGDLTPGGALGCRRLNQRPAAWCGGRRWLGTGS
jgi:hypothetical protein